ncbi:MAG: hypothetical protein ACRDWB_02405 [Acidimicrobiales bacterium]
MQGAAALLAGAVVVAPGDWVAAVGAFVVVVELDELLEQAASPRPRPTTAIAAIQECRVLDRGNGR